MNLNTQQDPVTQHNTATQTNESTESSFAISADNSLLLYSANPELLQEYERLTDLSDTDPLYALSEALKAAQKYEDEPLFSYLLEMAARKTNNVDLANQILEDNYRKFPFYLLIRCDYGMKCLSRNKLTEAAAAVAYNFDITKLYPQKSEFHLLEFMVFYSFIIEYFCELKDFNRAVFYFFKLSRIHKDLPGMSEIRTKVIVNILNQHLSYKEIELLLDTDQENDKEKEQ